MEVILVQDVDKIGKIGAVVKVKDGYARNFLFPNSLAVPLTSANLKNLEREKQRRVEIQEKTKQQAISLRDRLQKLSLTIPVLAQEGEKLYGGINTLEISQALKEEGIDLDKDAILLEEPIKTLGIYEVPVNLHPEIQVTLKIWVVKK